MNWSENSFYIIVIGLLGVAAIISSIMTIAKGIKQLNQPLQELKDTIEANEEQHKKIHAEHDKRLSSLEGRMIMSEEEREKHRNVNRLTLKALQALLSKDETEIKEVNKELKDYMTKESA